MQIKNWVKSSKQKLYDCGCSIKKFILLGKKRKIADISQQQNERIESKQREKMYEIRSLPNPSKIPSWASSLSTKLEI
jgi:hypothetical protein